MEIMKNTFTQVKKNTFVYVGPKQQHWILKYAQLHTSTDILLKQLYLNLLPTAI